jgi:SUMO ligase MMS21 Smc5/6 complex component
LHNEWKVRQVIFYLRGNSFVCFLLVKFMSDAERKELEEEDQLLKNLLKIYQEYRQDLRMTNDEWEQHVDTVLERIWEIKQLLRSSM